MIKLPLGVDINYLIDDLKIISWEAADLLMFYSKKIKNENQNNIILKTKINNDPVTLADLKVNELIISRIKDKYKDIQWSFLSEENFKINPNSFDKKAEWLWVLDPLDGTKDFIQGTGHYAMHLALNYRQKPFIGVVLIPEKGELWITNGEKVWCENRDGSIRSPQMSQRGVLKEMTLVTSKNHRNKKLSELIDKIRFNKIFSMGSIGCKIASIIRGESDIYISLSLPQKSAPKDWDFAAPLAILKAAGGEVTDIENNELSFGVDNLEHNGIIIASNNKEKHSSICSQLKETVKEYKIYPLDN